MGTGKRTKSNADRLMEVLGVSASEIGIEKAVRQHFADIGQDESVHDVTYENSQARERTQILMDIANKVGGIVLGTGDMSEAALGFSTYNGDHMSMYNVNCSVPKTLVKSLVKYISTHDFGGAVQDVVPGRAGHPHQPELLPVTDGELSQRPRRSSATTRSTTSSSTTCWTAAAAPNASDASPCRLSRGVYAEETINRRLCDFLRRFFAQQYKRNCVPDGPKVGSISLSPRGDLRMPSDMTAPCGAKKLPVTAGEPPRARMEPAQAGSKGREPGMSERQCPHCGRRITVDGSATFCPYCGGALGPGGVRPEANAYRRCWPGWRRRPTP
jgi:NAD+ synthase (glutamine-hydrolysing)